jgi:tRNA-dihydrouridine synthase B
MAGVSDRVFRELCKRHGADYAVSEMVASNPRLRQTDKTQRRLDQRGSSGIKIVQIAGAEPLTLANAARYCVDTGADVIDINMGCPAKKVCNKLAGSALMRDERLVGELLAAVVSAVDVPVTLKMRTGWDLDNRNAPRLAQLAESIGIKLLTVHGRSRACRFNGRAEYDTIATIKQKVNIPVLANGDIRSAADALRILDYTNCDGLMIGRAANGYPWIFAQVKAGLNSQNIAAEPTRNEIITTMHQHVDGLHNLYGSKVGCRVARKHVGWYTQYLSDGATLRRGFNQSETPEAQLKLINNYYNDPQGALAA